MEHVAEVFDEVERVARIAWRDARLLPAGPVRDRLVRSIAQSEDVIARSRGQDDRALLDALQSSLRIVRSVADEVRALLEAMDRHRGRALVT